MTTALPRRDALLALGALGLAPLGAQGQPYDPSKPLQGPTTPPAPLWDAGKGEFVLPALPYAYEALEPVIDAETMKIHHDLHHKAYVEGANKALKQLAAIRDADGAESAHLVKYWSRELAFHGAGHANHSFFWTIMAAPGKGGGGKPAGDLAAAIDRDFGSFDRFSTHFQRACVQVEGSGWGWLALNTTSGRLVVMQGEKQQDLTGWGMRPIIGCDVWEHAYYLKYRNKRADYVKAFMDVVNWATAGEHFKKAMG